MSTADHDILTDGLMTVTDVCKKTSLSRGMVYNLMDQGILPYRKIHNLRRIPAAAVDDYLRKQWDKADDE